MKNCVIDEIIAKKLKAYIVFEDNDFIAFLDHHPIFIGHTLISPKNHYQTLYDLPDKFVKPLFTLTQKIGKAVEVAMNSKGSLIAINNIVSQSIPHLHVHIIPRNKGDRLKRCFLPRTRYKNAQHFIETQQKIIEALKSTS